MPRSLHGRVDVTPETVREGREALDERIAEVEPAFALFNKPAVRRGRKA
jgi:hypothetical protein